MGCSTMQGPASPFPAAESLSLRIIVTEGEASIDTVTPRPWGGHPGTGHPARSQLLDHFLHLRRLRWPQPWQDPAGFHKGSLEPRPSAGPAMLVTVSGAAGCARVCESHREHASPTRCRCTFLPVYLLKHP